MAVITEIDARTYRAKIIAHIKLGHRFDAMRLLWPHLANIPEAREMILALNKEPSVCVGGHGSAMKTYLSCADYLLDYYEAPEKTAVIITAPTLVSMRARAWSDVKWLHLNTRVRMVGHLKDNIYRIVTKKDTDKPGVHGVIAREEGSQSKVQGLHLGTGGRTRLLIDEADNPWNRSIWMALDNMGTSGDLKVRALANPFDRTSEFAKNSEPECGWPNADPEGARQWLSRTGYWTYMVDGLRSHNIVAGKDDYDFLLTNKGVNRIKETKGTESAEWWAYVRGWFPPSGSIQSVFSGALVERICSRQVRFYADTAKIAGCDPSFGGGDKCVLAIAVAGRAALNPKEVCFQVTKLIYIKRTDQAKEVVEDYGDQIIEICKMEGVEPNFFGIDDTGPQGMADYIAMKWSKDILKVDFAGPCTEIPILDEDRRLPKDMFDRFVTELWFATKFYAETGLMGISNAPRDLKIQLEARLYEMHGMKSSLEKKDSMKRRGFDSPDESDSVVVLTHVVRLRFKAARPTRVPVPERHQHLRAKRGDPDWQDIKGAKAKVSRGKTIYRQSYGGAKPS